MKVLFDHNVPHKLRAPLLAVASHEIITVAHMGWARLKNGELLSAAENAGFDAFVTGDRTLAAEQNLTLKRLAILVLSTNNWPILKSKLGAVLQALEKARSGTISLVDCGEYRPAARGPVGFD